MDVGVDQPREDVPPAGVEDLGFARGTLVLADLANAAVPDDEGSVSDDRRSPRRQPADVPDDQVAYCQDGGFVDGSSGIRTPTSRAVSSAIS